MKKSSAWLALVLSFALLFSPFAGMEVEAKGKGKDKAPNGNKPLKQWEAIGYAAHIAGLGGSNADDIEETLTQKQLKQLMTTHFSQIQDYNWVSFRGSLNKAASTAWTLELWTKALAQRNGWTAIEWDRVDLAELAEELDVNDRHPKKKYQPNRPLKHGDVEEVLEELAELELEDLREMYRDEEDDEDGDDEDITTYTGIVTEIMAGNNAFKANVVTGNQTSVWVVETKNEVPIYLNGQVVAFSELRVGDRVDIWLEDDELDRVVIKDRDVVTSEKTGQVTGFTSGTSGRTLTITYTVGSVSNTETHFISNTVKVYAGNVEVPFSELRVGDQVKLSFSNNAVTRVDVLTATVERTGQLTTIVEASNGKTLTLQYTQNYVIHTQQYYVANTVKVYSGTVEVALADLRVGDQLKLTLWRDVVTRVDIVNAITQTLQGDVQTVTVSGDSIHLGIKDANQAVTTLTLNKNQVATYGDLEFTANDIVVGDDVKVTFARSRIVSVEIVERPSTVVQGVVHSVTQPTNDAPLGKIYMFSNNELVEFYITADTALPANWTLNQLLTKSVIVIGKGNLATSIIYNP